MNDDRPSPDWLLKAIKQKEKKFNQGSLKIFLGLAAGVGKTYAMLESAQNLVRQKTDLVVGVINTHGRVETEALLQGLKIVPMKKIDYKGLQFEELDIDEILRMKPSLVLIDEFAHTNVPGARHHKRWQDVVEILENGINVHTTLNVQHIESLKDVIEGISGIKIRESIPDSVIETADYIEIVDLTPEELLKRLKEGKVYLGDKSELAAQNFFQEDRLTALREIVLRYAAEKIDHDLQGLLPTYERVSGWKPRERLMVAINEDPYSEKLIRTTRRLASNQNAPWIAVYVNDGTELNEHENTILAKHFTLARDLGAEVITTNDPNIADGINRIARQRGVTQIILGRRPKRPIFGIFYRKSVLDRLARECADIDIHVIKQESKVTKYRKRLIALSFHTQPYFYMLALLVVSVLSALNWFLLPFIGYKLIGVLNLMYILFLSLFFRKGPIFAASIFCGLIWFIWFIPPAGADQISAPEDLAFLAIYLFTAMSTGILVDRAREHQNMLAKRERSTLALFDIVRAITAASTLQEALKSVKEGLERIFKGSFEVVVKNFDGGLEFNGSDTLLTDEKEINAAIWVFENGEEAGWSTDTLPSSLNLYMPIKSFMEVVGVIAYNHKIGVPLTPEERNFIYSVCQHLGNYIDRTFMEEKRRQSSQMQQIESMRTSILNRISMIFQQPLLISQNALKSLKAQFGAEKHKAALAEIAKIDHSMERLLEILANITAMARLSEGLIPLHKEPCDIKQIIEFCCVSLKNETAGHQLKIEIEPTLPLILLDVHLIEIVLFNLITNAVYYSPLQTVIEITAKRVNASLVVSVMDEGKGIPEDQLDAIFEKFYSLSDDFHRGIGLGLSIAKTIAEIHHGHLRAENRIPKGTIFLLSLPIE